MAFAPAAEAQFFWWFDQPKTGPKPRAVKPKPPGDDLPPIVPRESSVPPPPDDRPYDSKLMRLAEILGAVHYLRELCGAQEGQIWRDQMKEILRNEGTTAVRRAKLVNSFNDGYRGYRRTYRSCTQSATLATTRFSTEGATIAASLAQGSTFASKGPADAKPEASPEANKEGIPSEANKGEAASPDAALPEATSPEATGNVSQDAPATAPEAPLDDGPPDAQEPEPPD
ncbi:MAG: TIGR02301 family protein [Methyloceanibacter sp.]